MKEKFKTYNQVFDNHTINALNLLSGKGYFDELVSPIALGKEAVVFSASRNDEMQGNEDNEETSEEERYVAVKVYRLENCDFNRMYSYIKADLRYLALNRRKRTVIFSWTQREFRNLTLARKYGIRVPTPFIFRDNIIVMEQVGKRSPSPQLKDNTPKNPEMFYEKVIAYMKKLHKNGLVHGDLSEFNILNNDENPVFIDFSQSTTKGSALYEELLERDCRNIARYFSKKGVKTSMEELLKRLRSP